MDVNSSSTALAFNFEDLDNLGQEKVFSISVTLDKAREVVAEVSDEINNGSKPLIIVGDDVTKKYISNHVTNVSSITNI